MTGDPDFLTIEDVSALPAQQPADHGGGPHDLRRAVARLDRHAAHREVTGDPRAGRLLRDDPRHHAHLDVELPRPELEPARDAHPQVDAFLAVKDVDPQV